MRAVNFLGSETARTSAKVILEKACIIQTKVLLSSEANILLSNGAKLLRKIQKDAVVGMSVKGKEVTKAEPPSSLAHRRISQRLG